MTFAVLFGNRGFFPLHLVKSAREEMTAALAMAGHSALMMEESQTRGGGIETTEEGYAFASFLRANHGAYSGVIVCLPNFGDENGILAALDGSDVPILIHAYPDEFDKMGPKDRRDAFCGKLSVMDVLVQSGIKFTSTVPHVVHPTSAKFSEIIGEFARTCCVVQGMRRLNVGAIGARTSPFKTVRIDELALQRHGINVETFDMADVLRRVKSLPADSAEVKDMDAALESMGDMTCVPDAARTNLAKLGVILMQLVAEARLDAIAVRCWLELQHDLGISPCVLLGLINDRGISAACEVDIGAAVTMKALSLASEKSAACLDWNNNYGSEEDKCIIFHCGPVPISFMAGRGVVTDHSILANAVGPDCSYGCNTGRIRPMPVTLGNLVTSAGRLKFALGEGRITDDTIPDDFFGCAGVLEMARLQEVLLHLGYSGHRHHTAITEGHVVKPVVEAFNRYLGFEVDVL